MLTEIFEKWKIKIVFHVLREICILVFNKQHTKPKKIQIYTEI